MLSASNLRYLGQAARVFLAVTSAATFATALIWFGRPEYIDRLQSNLQARYLSPHEDALERVQKAIDDGDLRLGIAQLNQLLERLEGIKKGDRLEPVKKRALRKSLDTHLSLDEPREAIRRYNSLIALDERNLRAHAERASLLSGIPEAKVEATQEIERLYHMAPTVPILAQAFLELACRREDLFSAMVAASDIYRTSIVNARFGDWRFYWDTGNGFSRAQSWGHYASWFDRNKVKLRKRIAEPAQLLTFRVNLPVETHVSLKDVAFSFELGHQIQRFTKETVNFRGLKKSSRGIMTPRPRGLLRPPYFHFVVAEGLPLTGAGLGVAFEAELLPQLPPRMLPLLKNELLLQATRKRIAESEDDRLRSFFEEVVRHYLT